MKKTFSRIILPIILVCIAAVGILCRFLFWTNNQYFADTIKCIEHHYSAEESKIEAVTFKYENDKQGYYIFQTKKGHFFEVLFSIRNYKNSKYYNFKESYAIGDINNFSATWYEMGDFEYFIAKDEEFLEKYGEDKTPTYTQTVEYRVDGKSETSVVWLIDKTV